MVHSREDVVGGCVHHHASKVWQASGHLSGFSDPLVDCKVCKERFRADKAPVVTPGDPVTIELADKGRAKVALSYIAEQFGVEPNAGSSSRCDCRERPYVCPNCGSPFMSEERNFNLMFRSFYGPIDPMGALAGAIESGEFDGLKGGDLRAKLDSYTKDSTVYLRPETAQAMFVQYSNIQQSMALKIPFGIAQTGKSFRNEITVEHFIFRSCEFEQMEMEFFCEPGTEDEWFEYWKNARMDWWQKFANHPEKFVPRS